MRKKNTTPRRPIFVTTPRHPPLRCHAIAATLATTHLLRRHSCPGQIHMADAPWVACDIAIAVAHTSPCATVHTCSLHGAGEIIMLGMCIMHPVCTFVCGAIVCALNTMPALLVNECNRQPLFIELNINNQRCKVHHSFYGHIPNRTKNSSTQSRTPPASVKTQVG